MYSCLLVDDESIIRKGFRIMLEQSSLPITKITEAGDGEEALQHLREHLYDIIITDICMPKMDGLELCSKIYKRCSDISIILISGYDDFKYAQQAIKYGVKSYLLKPVNEEKLISTIKTVIQDRENEKNHYYIPYNNLETIVSVFEKGIWLNSNEDMKTGYELTSELFSSLSIEHSIQICSDIHRMIIQRLSLKMGYTLYIRLDTFEGQTHKELLQWFNSTLNDILDEISSRKINSNYNIIEMSKKYIKENFNKEITLENLANYICINPSYLSHIFKAKTNQTFIQYRTEVRMKKAIELLHNPDKSIADITNEIGYNDVTHFIRTFRKYSGSSPTEYRKRLENRL